MLFIKSLRKDGFLAKIVHMLMNFNGDSEKGFSIVELLVGLSIVGILTGVLIMILKPDLAYRRGRDATSRATVAKLAKSVNFYEAANDAYPTCGIFLEWVEGVNILSGQCTNPDDTSVIFGVAGVNLPSNCSGDMHSGTGDQQCYFRYEASSPTRIYGRSWEFEEEYVCWSPDITGDAVIISDCNL